MVMTTMIYSSLMFLGRKRIIRRELDQMLRDGMIDLDTHRRLWKLYPLNPWKWLGNYLS